MADALQQDLCSLQTYPNSFPDPPPRDRTHSRLMGRRGKGIAGLSRFAKDAFQAPKSTPSPDVHHPSTPPHALAATTTPPQALEHTFDPSGLVPHYKCSEEVPPHLQKYFAQRTRYFLQYDRGCLLDEEGWYSVTPERIADQIAQRCRCDVVLDAFCGVGGNAIAFAKTCHHVIALDISPTRLALARHNATIYGVADRIDFILADYLDFARTCPPRAVDVVFLSPPWGGPGYLEQNGCDGDTIQRVDGNGIALRPHPEFDLADIKPVHGAELFRLTRRITRNVAYYLPRNTRLQEISELISPSTGEGAVLGKGGDGDGASEEMVEVEEEWMGSKLKALTCYFGGLAAGQEHLF